MEIDLLMPKKAIWWAVILLQRPSQVLALMLEGRSVWLAGLDLLAPGPG